MGMEWLDVWSTWVWFYDTAFVVTWMDIEWNGWR